MAIEETVVIKTDTKSLADLRKEITSIQAQLDLTPTGTKEYDDLVIKLRQAKGEIKDFKEATKGLDPDQRAAKLVNAFQGMTGAIQSAAGALTLFGGNSEDLEKVEKNLLGIIAIGGGIQQTIEGYNDAIDVIGPKLSALGQSIKSSFTTASGAVNGFKVALAGIGIGLLITAVVLLADKLEGVDEASKKAAAGIAELAKKQRELRGELQALNETELETAERNLNETLELRKKISKDQAILFDDLNRAETESQKLAIRERIDQKTLEYTQTEIDEKKFRAQIKSIQDQANKQQKADVKQLNDDLEKLAEERKAFILKNEDGLREALQQLAIDSAATERERAQTELDNTLADLKVAREREVAEANRLGVDVLKVNQKFDALEKDARIKFNKDIDEIDKNARDKRLAELATERTKIIDEYDKLLQQFEPGGISTTNLEQAIQRVTFLQKKYGENLIEVDRLTRDNVIELGKSTEKGLTDREEIIKRGAKRYAALGDNIEQEIRGKQQFQVQFLSNLQKELEDSFNKSIAAATGNQEEIDRLQKEYTKSYEEIEQKKVAITKKAAEDIVAVRKAQAKKEENIREGIAKLDQEDIQRITDIAQFYLNAADSFTSTLNIFYEAAANRRTNAINEQIKAEYDLAKARGASQAELERITEDGNDRLEAEAQRTFKIQQDFAVAAALIDGASAVLRIFSNAAANPKSILFPAQPYIEAALATAFTVAKINQIKSTSLSGGGSGYGAVGGGSGGSSSANPFSTGGFGGGGTNVLPPRLAPKRNPNEFQADTTGQFGELGATTPIFRTYVLAGDVTDAQVANEKINQKRKL